MYYVLLYKTVSDHAERRAPYRPDHLAHVQAAFDRGHIVMAGALAEPMDSAILVFKTEDKAMIEDFARNDPYVINGLIVEWQVRPWTVVVGG